MQSCMHVQPLQPHVQMYVQQHSNPILRVGATHSNYQNPGAVILESSM